MNNTVWRLYKKELAAREKLDQKYSGLRQDVANVQREISQSRTRIENCEQVIRILASGATLEEALAALNLESLDEV